MLGLVGLPDDPSNEHLGLLPRLRQQLERNHIEHLYGLVEFGVLLTQIIQPKQEEEQLLYLISKNIAASF